MPVVISASRFKPSGYQSLQTLVWHSFAALAALCTSVAPLVLKVKSWQGPYCDSDSRPHLRSPFKRVLPSHFALSVFHS